MLWISRYLLALSKQVLTWHDIKLSIICNEIMYVHSYIVSTHLTAQWFFFSSLFLQAVLSILVKIWLFFWLFCIAIWWPTYIPVCNWFQVYGFLWDYLLISSLTSLHPNKKMGLMFTAKLTTSFSFFFLWTSDSLDLKTSLVKPSQNHAYLPLSSTTAKA